MNKLVKSSVYAICGLILLAFAFKFAFKFAFLKNKNSDEELVENSINVTTSQPVEEYKYLLKEFNGKLAVFENGEKAPKMIFDVSIDSLPEVDALALKNGLKIYISIPIIPFHSDLDDKEDMTTSFSVSVDEWHINKEATRWKSMRKRKARKPYF